LVTIKKQFKFAGDVIEFVRTELSSLKAHIGVDKTYKYPKIPKKPSLSLKLEKKLLQVSLPLLHQTLQPSHPKPPLLMSRYRPRSLLRCARKAVWLRCKPNWLRVRNPRS
jgi:hypothetical protein